MAASSAALCVRKGDHYSSFGVRVFSNTWKQQQQRRQQQQQRVSPAVSLSTVHRTHGRIRHDSICWIYCVTGTVARNSYGRDDSYCLILRLARHGGGRERSRVLDPPRRAEMPRGGRGRVPRGAPPRGIVAARAVAL